MHNIQLKLILGVFIIGILNSCTQPGYKIKGTIENGKINSVKLEEIKVRELISIDSATTSEKGNFEFTDDLKNPKFFVIRTSNKKVITLLVEPHENIKLKINAMGNGADYTIKGSKGSQLIKELNDKLYATMDRIDSLGHFFKDSVNENNYQSLKSRLDSIHKSIILQHKDFLISFIENNYQSLATIPAIFQQYAPQRYFIKPIEDISLFEMIDTALMARYSDLEQVKSLNAFISRNKKQKQESELNEKVLGIGAIAPDIIQLTPTGDTLALSSLRGKYILLDFWASWCKPCRAENPNLVANYNKYKDMDFDIYQVSLDRTKDAWIQAIEADRLKWNHVSDLQYWNSGPARLYNVRSIPANYLLDKEGKIIAKNLRGADLGAKLAKVLSN